MNQRWTRTTKLLLISCVLTSGVAMAKPKVFKWSDDMCSARAMYDDKKVSAHQLKATLGLKGDQLISLYQGATQAQNDAEHERIQNFLRTPSNFIAHPAVEVVRQRRIERDRFFYKLDKVKRDARQTQDYRVLDEFVPAQIPQCQAIAQTIQSPPSEQKTLSATRILTADCSDNGNPKECVARSLSRWTQSTELMNEGLLSHHWHNCANHQQPEITEQERAAVSKVFEKNVGKIRYLYCEEP